MHYYKAFGLNISSEIHLPELSVGKPGVLPDLIVQAGKIDCPSLSPTKIFRRGIQAFFGQDQANALYLRWDGVAAFKAEGNLLTVDAFTSTDQILSLFTVSEAMGLILFQKSLLLLHASSVQVGDEGWVFMGEPGAGKSSTAAAFIKAGCALLSDDLSAIGMDEGGTAQVVPAYPQLKIWHKTVTGLDYDDASLTPVGEGINKFAFVPAAQFPEVPCKLGKVFFLHSNDNEPPLSKLAPGVVPGEFVKNFPLPAELLSGDYLRSHFVRSLQIAGSAEIYRLRRPEGFVELEEWVGQMIKTQLIQAANATSGDIS